MRATMTTKAAITASHTPADTTAATYTHRTGDPWSTWISDAASIIASMVRAAAVWIQPWMYTVSGACQKSSVSSRTVSMYSPCGSRSSSTSDDGVVP